MIRPMARGTLSVTGSTTVVELRIEPATGATIALVDDDSPAVLVTPDTLIVVEAESDTYAVELRTRPTADVTVTITGASGDLSLDRTSLVFTQADWRDPAGRGGDGRGRRRQRAGSRGDADAPGVGRGRVPGVARGGGGDDPGERPGPGVRRVDVVDGAGRGNGRVHGGVGDGADGRRDGSGHRRIGGLEPGQDPTGVHAGRLGRRADDHRRGGGGRRHLDGPGGDADAPGVGRGIRRHLRHGPGEDH